MACLRFVADSRFGLLDTCFADCTMTAHPMPYLEHILGEGITLPASSNRTQDYSLINVGGEVILYS